jgi:hypothetical protein
MKTLLLFLALVPLSLAAQKPDVSETYVGLQGSAGFSRVAFDPRVTEDLKPSQSFGLVLRHVSEPHVGVQLEVNYTQKGWIENRDSLGTYTRSRSVADIPVTAAFIAGKGKVRAVVTLGPYVSLRLKDEEKIALTDDRYAFSYYGHALADRWEFGFTGGISLEWHAPVGVFALRATYAHSLTNVFLLSGDAYVYSASRNQVILGGLSYYIQL